MEAIVLDSGEATKVAQLWTAGARLHIMKTSSVKQQVGLFVRTGAGSLRTGAPRKGSVMDKDWKMSSGSERADGDDVGVSGSDGDDSDDAAHVAADSGDGSGKGGGRKRIRELIVEGRWWRRKAADDGFLFDKDRSGGRGVVPVSVRGRCTLERIYKFNKTLKPHQRKVIEGTILKPILDYRPFFMQRELTTALVKAWVPWRKAFRLAGRFVPFSMYDVAFFTSLSVTGKRVEFGEDDLSATELARMVRLCMAQYITEKSDKLKREKGSKKLVFRNYIKVMKKLLDANKELEKLGLWLSLCTWMAMSGVMFPRTP
ncbi:hypothetical protein Cgig2_013612 [Carnegiea gigantea]|uniref:Uncharacterized protein n=1 Tax=Carnegiea gigantea TaxID=171969 RepID=A0A9Q1KBS9_9CARY|nr:hypothetical protein Cgig2_013612 [Carnegiea gigantea]